MSRRIYVIVGAKGGVGATSIAIKLVQRFPALGERVIVDADFAGKRSLAVWYDLSAELDHARVVGSSSAVPAKDGPLVVELARTYEDGLLQNAASVMRTLAGFSEQALVIVDAPQPLAATVRPFLAAATKIIVVTEPTLLGVGCASSVLAAMNRNGVPASLIALVLSDLSGKSSLPRGEIERTLGVAVQAELTSRRDRRFEGLFDGFITTLAAAPPVFRDPDRLVEKPVFDRRNEPRDAFQ